MHVTEKIVDEKGVHILSSTIEADGPFEVVSPKGSIEAKVIAVRRTDSGGIFVQTAVSVAEPTPEPVAAPAPVEKAPTPEELATDFLQGNGLSAEEAAAAVSRFGAAAILRKKNVNLDAELDALLAPPAKKR
jgi:hypothetical protein